MIIKRFYKTNHFWKRAWERGIHQAEIDKLLEKTSLRPEKGKRLLVFSKNTLKYAGIVRKGKSYLVIVAKYNVLITIFEVPDLFYYLRKIKDAKIILL